MKTFPTMASIIITSIIILVIAVQVASGLNIVVTFPNLKEDIKLIAPNDNVMSVAKPGVDPHLYQLTPDDVRMLKNADLIISTAHTPFEIEIRNLVKSGEIKAKLIEIPKIPHIKILKVPGTGIPNYHMPIYDPKNYETFLKFVANVLERMNPGERYTERAMEVCKEVNEIVSKTRKLNVKAVADIPAVQYAVDWLNVSIVRVLVKTPGAPITPKDVTDVERAMKDIQLVVVTNGSVPSQTLIRLAREYGKPVLKVPSPIEDKSVLKKLRIISEEVLELKPPKKTPGFESIATLIALVLVSCSRSR